MSKAPVIWAAVITAYDVVGAATTTLYYASRGWNTTGSDTPADTHFDERLVVSGLRLPMRSMWSEEGTFGRQVPGEGELELANGDGELDDILAYGFDGREIAIYRGQEGDAFPGSWTKYVYTMDGQPEEGVQSIRIRMREKAGELDKPYQATLYAGNNSLPAGLEGVEDLKGKPKPDLLGGSAFNIPAVLVNSSKLIYQVRDGALASVDEVRDSGVNLGRTVRAWTQKTSGTANDLFAVAAHDTDEVLVAVGASGTIIRSTNGGDTWAAATTPNFGTDDVLCVGYCPSIDTWVAGGASAKLAYSTDDGDTWTQITGGSNPFSGADRIQCFAWGEKVTAGVAGSDTGVVGRTTNGTSFSAVTVASAKDFRAAVFAANNFILVDGTIGSGVSQVSPTGTSSTWTPYQGPVFPPEGLAHNRGVTVACGGGGSGNGAAISLDDGATWTETELVLNNNYGAAWAPSISSFVVVGDDSALDDVVLTAPRGVSWTNNTAGFSGSIIYGAAGTLQEVVAVGAGGKIAKADAAGTYASEADLLDDDLAPSPGTFKAYLTGGYFRLGSPPAGEITCDATAGAAASDRTHAQLWVDVLTKAGKSGGDWSASDITAADSANSSVAGFWIGPDERPTFAHVADRIARSCGAWWGTDRSGVYRFQIVVAPAGTADVDAVKGDVKGLQRMAQRGAVAIPAYQTVMRYLRNHAVQTSGLALAVSDANRGLYAAEWRTEKSTDATVQTKHLLARELVVDSIFTTSAGASTEASRVQTLRGSERQRYQFRIEDDADTKTIDLNDVVDLTYDRFDLTSGKKFLLTGVQPEPGTGMLLWTVWG